MASIKFAKHARRTLVGVDVENRIGIVLASQKRLEFKHGRLAAMPDQRRAAPALNQGGTTQHQCLHDDLAQRGFCNHQCPQACRAHHYRQDILHGDAVHELGHAGKLSDISQEIPRTMLDDHRAGANAVALHDTHAPFQHQDHAIGRVAGMHHVIAGTPRPFAAVGGDPCNLGVRQMRIHLLPGQYISGRILRRIARRVGGSGFVGEGVHGCES